MVERIRALLTTRQLTPTQFADAIGVGRPIVSHILSGRNKPSLEVVQKILSAFPDLSISWLLSGQGDMLGLSNSSSPASAPKTEQKMVDKERQPKSPPAKPAINKPLQAFEVKPALGSITQAPAESVVNAPIASSNIQPGPAMVIKPTTVAQPAQEPTTSFLSGLVDPGKAIRRIVIFYQDGTFSAYQPE
ncbi:helix-turn-helix domain-containing protein [Hymenobacter sp. BT730]|uniref:helix-turn-helix domain-containing protein n=1 Tax=Hymenobacter sp. BT730 TaxID=3063332 RepID=UPI0026E05F9D|nr:helix-turn-helix transcriptional regulator [Hymenobacter sp. BT730]